MFIICNIYKHIHFSKLYLNNILFEGRDINRNFYFPFYQPKISTGSSFSIRELFNIRGNTRNHQKYSNFFILLIFYLFHTFQKERRGKNSPGLVKVHIIPSESLSGMRKIEGWIPASKHVRVQKNEWKKMRRVAFTQIFNFLD